MTVIANVPSNILVVYQELSHRSRLIDELILRRKASREH